MDVSKVQQSSQTNPVDSSRPASGSATRGKSPDKDNKAKSLDIGFKEKVAQPQSEGKGENLAGRVDKAPASFGCSGSCGCR